MRRLLLAIVFATFLSGCSPAIVLNLYNAAGDTINITRDRFPKDTTTIAAGTSGEFPIAYVPGERLHISTGKHSWTYSLHDIFPPRSFLSETFMTMRGYAKIDNRGNIYLLSPSRGEERPHEITQPTGFPVKPQKT